ncbi:MAG: NAD(P)-dependent oxidoreductase, partial [Desulfobulbia bacterium]
SKTKGMIGKSEINQMKKTSYLINNARGSLVDLEALSDALKKGRIAGAAIDVFPNEPSSNSETFTSNLNGLDNVVLTPHIGGSTNEAQERIGVEVARKLIDYIDSGSTTGAVNFPNIKLDASPSKMRFMQVHRNVPGELRRLNDVFSRNGINILSQQFKAEGDIGYVVLDMDSVILDTIAEEILREVRMSENTIRANFF